MNFYSGLLCSELLPVGRNNCLIPIYNVKKIEILKNGFYLSCFAFSNYDTFNKNMIAAHPAKKHILLLIFCAPEDRDFPKNYTN